LYYHPEEENGFPKDKVAGSFGVDDKVLFYAALLHRIWLLLQDP